MISNRERRRRSSARTLISVVLMSGGCAGPVRTQHRMLSTALQTSEAGAASPSEPSLGPDHVDVLSRATFVQAVLDRNPNVAAAREAWRAATAQVPQRLAIDGPRIEYAFAPLSIGASEVDFGQSVTLQQMLPWPGLRNRAGDLALAEARAVRADFETTRLDLGLTACLLFDAYYIVHRELEVVKVHLELLQEIGLVALAQYESGREPMQGPIQAEIEAALVERQRLELTTRRAALSAQMNALLHRPPRTPLPPPPRTLDALPAPPDEGAATSSAAIAGRPELTAARERSQAGASAVGVARGAFFPELGVMTSFSTMWPMPQHRWMLGVGVNVPLAIGAQRAAVTQARAEQARLGHELDARTMEIRAEVEQARAWAQEAEQVLELYSARLLPAAHRQHDVVQSAYATGTGSLAALLTAERTLRDLELARETATAELYRRRAELWRALGHIPGSAQEGARP